MPRLPHPRTALSGYADARLPAWQRVVVGHHLRGCTRCAVEVGQIRGLTQMLRAIPPPVAEAPAGLVERLLGIDAAEPPAMGGGPPSPDAVAAEPVDEPVMVAPVMFVPVSRAAVPADAHVRPSVGAAGMLVAAVVMVGTVGAGAVVTGVPVPWPSATTRASVATVLMPRLSSGTGEPGGAASVRPVDNGERP